MVSDLERVRCAIANGIIDESDVLDAMQREMTTLDNPGFCLDCGHEQDGCEPDARDYPCEACGKRSVFGAAEIVLCMDAHAL